MKKAPTAYQTAGAGEQVFHPAAAAIVLAVADRRDAEHQHADGDGRDRLDEPSRQFIGTENPRHLRVLDALMLGPLSREQVDRVGGASNGPELISELRSFGLDIPCERKRVHDRDGKPVWAGIYSLTPADKAMIQAWRTEREAA